MGVSPLSSRPHPHHPSSPTPSQGPPTFSKGMSLETIPSQAPGAPAGAWSALPAKRLLQPQAAERPPHPGCSRCCPAPGRLRTPSFSAGRQPQGPRGSSWCAGRDARRQDRPSVLCTDFAARATRVLVSIPSRSFRTARAHPLGVNQHPLRRRPGRSRRPPRLPRYLPRPDCSVPLHEHPPSPPICSPPATSTWTAFSVPDSILRFFLPAPGSPSSIPSL